MYRVAGSGVVSLPSVIIAPGLRVELGRLCPCGRVERDVVTLCEIFEFRGKKNLDFGRNVDEKT